MQTQTQTESRKLKRLGEQYLVAIERQSRLDAAVLAGVVRALKAPRGSARCDAEELREIIKTIAKE
jgi:DNA-binding transcriptional ArsR family regulator